MATVQSILQQLNSFWSLFEKEDQVFLGSLGEGYALAVNDLYCLLYAIDLAKSIKTITPTVRREWFHLNLTYLNAVGPFTFSIDEEIVSIPVLQDGVTDPVAGSPRVLNKLLSGTDYTIDSKAHTVTFTSVAAKNLVSRDVALVDSLSRRTPAGDLVTAGLAPLIAGIDYTLVSTNLIRLFTKAAFDKFAASGDQRALQVLTQKIIFCPSLQTDEELVYRNFGFLLGISPSDVPVDLVTYTNVVKGLWYIAWNGPTPRNLRNGVSLLFGYPVAPVAGDVARIDTVGPDKVVVITPDKGASTISITVPTPFIPIVTVGQNLREFDSLSDAVLIQDERNTPNWWKTGIGLARYTEPGYDFSGLTSAREEQLKGIIKNAVFAIKLKDFSTFTDITVRAQILTAASKFLSQIKPYYVQFSFLGDVPFTEVGADTVGTSDTGFSLEIRKTIHQTVADNSPNKLNDPSPPGHQTTPFANVAAYDADAAMGDDDRTYYLGDDDPGTTEAFAIEIKHASWGNVFVAEGNGSYTAFQATKLTDTVAPLFNLQPPPGTYVGETFVRVRVNEPARVLYTLDGSVPAFSPQNGFQMVDKILMREGTTNLKLIARDVAGNTTTVTTATYLVFRSLAPMLLDPLPGLKSKTAVEHDAISATFASVDPTIDVYYSLDGSDPTDFVFQDVDRLGGHKLIRVAPTAVALENSDLPIFFARGPARLNVDGPRSYEWNALPNTRYFAYAIRQSENRWKLSIGKFNTAFNANTPSRLLVGYVITDASGQISTEGVINAVTAGHVTQIVKNGGLPATRQQFALTLNSLGPVAISSAKEIATLRFFGKTAAGQFDPPQRAIYVFDNTPPKTTIRSALTNTPYAKTLKIELFSEPGSITYYSLINHAPRRVRFGFPDRLQTLSPFKQLRVTVPLANKIAPTETTITIVFKRKTPQGDYVTLTTTADLRAGAQLDVPISPDAFIDVCVVPDFDNPTRWRLELGEPNIPAVESTDRYLVNRLQLDSLGVLPTTTLLNNALDSDSVPALLLTNKFIEPLNFDVGSPPYNFDISFFSVDIAGNAEQSQVTNFKG